MCGSKAYHGKRNQVEMRSVATRARERAANSSAGLRRACACAHAFCQPIGRRSAGWHALAMNFEITDGSLESIGHAACGFCKTLPFAIVTRVPKSIWAMSDKIKLK